MFAFDHPGDWAYVAGVAQLFEERGAEIDYVELDAPQAVRMARNKTENRLQNKPSKRNLDFSEQLLLKADQKYRCESLPGEIPFKNYLRIDNTNLTPPETAAQIKEYFKL